MLLLNVIYNIFNIIYNNVNIYLSFIYFCINVILLFNDIIKYQQRALCLGLDPSKTQTQRRTQDFLKGPDIFSYTKGWLKSFEPHTENEEIGR